MSALKEDLAGTRQLRFRVDGRVLHLFKQKGESTHHVYLKVALAALYRPAYPDLEIDPRIDCKYQPHVAMVDYTNEVRFWGHVGPMTVDHLAYVLKHTDAEQVVLADEDIDLEARVAYLKRQLHYRYTTGKLRICVFRPLDEWFDPDDVVVTRTIINSTNSKILLVVERENRMQLDQIRQLAEERNQAIGREYYPHGAGLKDTLDLASVLNKYADLNNRDVIQTVMDALHAADDPTDKRQHAYLLGDCLEGYINTAVSALDDAVATAESKRAVSIEGKEVPFRQSASLLSNETDRLKRLAIEQSRAEVTKDVNALRLESLKGVRRLITEDLGYPGYTEFYSELKQVDFPGFSALMKQFMRDTQELYATRLNEWTREEMGVPASECYRHDISFIMRAVKFDPFFPESKLKATLTNTLTNLGIDLRSQKNIILDIEKRPTKSPRAFVVAAQVPDEVYLVVQPRGGRDDYGAILHESGHAEHFGNSSKELPYEFRWLGDYSVTECFAFTMELLTLDAGWLKQHLNMPDEVIKEYQKYAYTVLFYLIRRYSSKLEYELALHDNRPIDDKAHLYSEIMEKNLLVKHNPVLWLSDVDPGFYSANYLRAWIMWAQLRKHLKQTYGPEWFNSREAGAFLKKVWSLGQSLPAEELVKQFGYEGLDIGPLKDELIAVLGTPAPVAQQV